jgi:type IV secretion system protein TrbJ
MRPVIKRHTALLAMVCVAFMVDRQAKAVVFAGFATELTQLANKLQLLSSYLRQGQQLTQEIRMVLDMTRNSAQLPSQVFGPIATDIAQLANIVQGGRALAYSTANLDAAFRNRFNGWGYNSGAWYLRYRDWSQTSLDTTLGTLRAAGLQGEQLQSEQALLERLRVMAQSSDGRMQALQVANQIAEQEVQQIMKLRQLMLADLQSKQAFQAAQIQRQAASESASEKFFTFGGRTGDGRGFQAGQ